MLFFWLALAFAIFAALAKSAKMGSVAKVSAVIAFLSFMAWLFGGAGLAAIGWIEDPSVPVPDNIPFPGQ